MDVNVGDLCILTNGKGVRKYEFNQQYYALYDNRPVLEDGIWIGKQAKRLDYVVANKDYFVLLEMNEANECNYPKVLTTKGVVGYLYLHNDNEGLEKVIEKVKEK